MTLPTPLPEGTELRWPYRPPAPPGTDDRVAVLVDRCRRVLAAVERLDER